MSYPVVFSNFFEESLTDAFDWYREQSDFAALHLLDRVDHAIRTIQKNPFLFQIQKKDFRQVILSPFPYVLIYKARKNDVFVFKIFHTSRSPKKKFYSRHR